MTAAAVGRFLLKELKIVLPPTIYFFCAFNLIVFTTNLMVHHYWFALSNFLVATALALIVGKVILVTDKFHFIDRYRGPPPGNSKSGLERAAEKEYISRLPSTNASYGIHPHSRRSNA